MSLRMFDRSLQPEKEKIKYWFHETNNFTGKHRIIAFHVQFYELNASIW
jgi:hypothetical protein